MFKDQTNLTSNLFMPTISSKHSSSYHGSKPEQIQNFSHLLKRLESQNVNIDELRLLKTQHTYLEKLRNQRQKIEELKIKFTQCQRTMHKYQEQSRSHVVIIQDYEETIQMLKEQLQEEQNQRQVLENSVCVKYETENNKLRVKLAEVTKQNDQMKKLSKNKELRLMQLQEQVLEQSKSLKEQFNQARKKLMLEVEERLKQQMRERSQMQTQVIQLRNLVTKQNKALKQQNVKYQQLSDSHTKLAQQLQRCNEQITNLTLACQQYQQKIDELQNNNQALNDQVNQITQGSQGNGQIDDLRKRMAEMAKGEIQKIEFIVNQFE